MKRSEMVKHVQQWVVHPVTCNPIWDMEEASEFLDTFEEYGMLPPSYNCCLLTGQPDKYGSGLMHDWEPENSEPIKLIEYKEKDV